MESENTKMNYERVIESSEKLHKCNYMFLNNNYFKNKSFLKVSKINFF